MQTKRLFWIVLFMVFSLCSYSSNENMNTRNLLFHEGSGSVSVELKSGNFIDVFYHKPKKYDANSPVLFVVPGGGRNGDTYRDTWVEKSEHYGLLILSPSYVESAYPGPVNYNMAKMMRSTDISGLRKYEVVKNRGEWIFNDFDYIFDIVTQSLKSNQTMYDIFGHSAGGQIVHRLILFSPESKVNRALAANSGWYTSTDTDTKFPYGLKDAPIAENGLSDSFSKNLVVFLGALDNEYEKRGHLRKTAETNLQGKGRLERGTYFFKTAKSSAKNLDLDFNWGFKVIPDVGHSYKEMGYAAADYLYGGGKVKLNKTIKGDVKKPFGSGKHSAN